MTSKIFTTIALDLIKKHYISIDSVWRYEIKEYYSFDSPIVPHIVEIWAGKRAEVCIFRITGNKETIWDDVITKIAAIGVEKLFIKHAAELWD